MKTKCLVYYGTFSVTWYYTSIWQAGIHVQWGQSVGTWTHLLFCLCTLWHDSLTEVKGQTVSFNVRAISQFRKCWSTKQHKMCHWHVSPHTFGRHCLLNVWFDVPHVLLFQLWWWQVLPDCVWIHPCEVQRGGPAVGLSSPGLGLQPVTGRSVTQENLQVCGESSGSLCLQSGSHSHPQQDISPRSRTSFETWVKAPQAQVCSGRQLLQVYWIVDSPTEYLSDKVSLFQVTCVLSFHSRLSVGVAVKLSRLVRRTGRGATPLTVRELSLVLKSSQPPEIVLSRALSSVASLLRLWRVQCLDLTDFCIQGHPLLTLVCHQGPLSLRSVWSWCFLKSRNSNVIHVFSFIFLTACMF